MRQASFFKEQAERAVRCMLCRHQCVVPEGKKGRCGVRANQGGILYSLNYGRVVAAQVDPVEKKPLFHFFPGSLTYSIAAAGCNFSCSFCQNWRISQVNAGAEVLLGAEELSPGAVVEEAVAQGCRSIAFTYTEPTVSYEFVFECARLAKTKGLYTIFVTNGYMGREALGEFIPYLDAANVDLKSFREDFYQTCCGASLQAVLDTIVEMKRRGVWVEVTTLLIPGANDSVQELYEIASFILSVDRDIPWHISRFHPGYKFTDRVATPRVRLEEAYRIGKEVGLHFIYIGNISSECGGHTYCPYCQRRVIERTGFFVKEKALEGGKCGFCGGSIAGYGL